MRDGNSIPSSIPSFSFLVLEVTMRDGNNIVINLSDINGNETVF